VVIQINNNLLYTDFVRSSFDRNMINQLFDYAEQQLKTMMDIENIKQYARPEIEKGKDRYITQKKFKSKDRTSGITKYLKRLYKKQTAKAKKLKNRVMMDIENTKMSFYEEVSARLGFKP
jgi:hypothetical protein